MNASSDASRWRTRRVIALRVIGGMTVSAGLLVCALCAILFFNRSPEDFEGTAQMAAVHVGLVYGLPTLLAGSMVLGFAHRARRATPSDTSYEPKVTP
ncbi:hypothetical protein LJR143_004109 [Pseudoxanthomonas sp. LjRoot143]|uniref:hypothetical protein n=1 Tax=unclassified Pseudoxanthomonas TaxID=2645906 RepID=UPI001783753A|nr:hypothetical protein [Pseudoxanthomonas sp. PXM01]MBD9471070.1 hypothetical protein [Pseudoxanthomonas sp. PXM01]